MSGFNSNDKASLVHNIHASPTEQATSSAVSNGGHQIMTAIPMIHGETTDTTNNSQIDQNFSVRTFKILGRMQIVLGAIMCTLSLVNATVDGINMKKSEESVTVEGFIIDSICIVIPGWVCYI